MLAREHNISEVDLDLFHVVDTAGEAVKLINSFYSRYLLSPISDPEVDNYQQLLISSVNKLLIIS